MGDHRFTITIKMEFHGIKAEIKDGWFNWDGGRDGIDSRIISLIENVRDRGFAQFDKDMAEHYARQNKDKIEKAERAELDRLKAKYEKAKHMSTEQLIIKAQRRYDAMSPEQQREMRESQLKSWVVGNLLLDHPELTRHQAEEVYEKVVLGIGL